MSTASSPGESFVASEAKRTQALEHVRQANVYRSNGATADMHSEIGKAWKLLDAACEVCPGNHRARFLLVSLCMNDDNFRRAKRESELILQGLTREQMQEMDDLLLHLTLVHACKMLGEFQAAIKYAREASELVPNNPQPHMVLGELLELTADHIGAERCCSEALSKNEAEGVKYPLSAANVVFTLSVQAAAQLRLGRFRDAEASAKQGISVDRTIALPLIRLSEVYQAEGRLQEAVDVAEQASKLDPSDGYTSQRLAILKKGSSGGRAVVMNDDGSLQPGSSDGNLQPGTGAQPGSARRSPHGSLVGAPTSARGPGSNVGSKSAGPDGSAKSANCLCCFDR